MNKEKILSTLLEEFKEQLPSAASAVKREVILPDVEGMINVAIGVRRSGKTFLNVSKSQRVNRARSFLGANPFYQF